MVSEGGIARLVRLIDAERARQGLSGRELSARAGLGVATVSNVLSGQSAPELDTVEALAGALGYSMETFLAMALRASRRQADTELIADIVDQLPEADRRAILSLATYYRDLQSSGR
jgi:transcriptional regulator with XRE-family HTH domain